MRIAPESAPFLLITAALIPVTYWLAGSVPALLPVVATLFVLYFFRDPHREPPVGKGLVLSPADGKIVDVQEVDDESFPGGRARRVSIFLSIFDVHVNRAPAAAEVRKVRYQSGRFRAAFHGKASEENERNRLDLLTDSGPLAVTQIAGAVARRIVCDVAAGQRIEAGERLGLIRFGSRVDVFLPPAAHLSVKKGDRVRTTATALAVMPGEEVA